MREEIVITIDTDASVTLTVNGVKGKSCKDLTRDYEQKLGKTVDDKTTEEFYQNAGTGIRNRI